MKNLVEKASMGSIKKERNQRKEEVGEQHAHTVHKGQGEGVIVSITDIDPCIEPQDQAVNVASGNKSYDAMPHLMKQGIEQKDQSDADEKIKIMSF